MLNSEWKSKGQNGKWGGGGNRFASLRSHHFLLGRRIEFRTSPMAVLSDLRGEGDMAAVSGTPNPAGYFMVQRVGRYLFNCTTVLTTEVRYPAGAWNSFHHRSHAGSGAYPVGTECYFHRSRAAGNWKHFKCVELYVPPLSHTSSRCGALLSMGITRLYSFSVGTEFFMGFAGSILPWKVFE
jgi:hypothetical protein